MAGRGRAAVGLLVLLCSLFGPCGSFNLDEDKPFVFSGPEGSYFGFSVDFFQASTDLRSDVLIGAPRANASSSSSVVERGAVYSCPWAGSSSCQQVLFDSSDDRTNTEGAKMEFKSKQWFGASVRSDGEHILACAPLYQWSTYGVSEREPVGTCFLKKGDAVVEYSPCRSTANSPEGQGFCQAGFSADFLKEHRVVVGGPGSFYWQGQLISDDVAEIFKRFDKKYVIPYGNTLSTKSASAQYDDSYLDYVTGVPRGDKALGYVNIFNNLNMESMVNFTGTQMAAYFGHSVAATDVNNDGLVDLLVGAPLFMDRGPDGKLREVGQVSVYLGRGGFSFHPPQQLIGSEVYARYGSAITTLGDLDMDGFNDVAISAPYGGPDRYGRIYIHNGRPQGPNATPSQVLKGKWASSYMPSSFGYSMTGNTDIDKNGYPGTQTHKNTRARVHTQPAASALHPLSVSQTNPAALKTHTVYLYFRVDLELDRLKQKESTKRVLFLHDQAFHYSKNMVVNNGKGPTCEEQFVYLGVRHHVRDKITPISVAMDYTLNYQMAADPTGLLPILHMSTPSNVTKQAHILLDCGDDNICKPDLKLSVKSDREQIYIGDDNALTLEVVAENKGEGAYEAELHIYPPQLADFTRVVPSDTHSRVSCTYKKENQTKIVVCDLGNPMKAGTVTALSFSVHLVSEEETSVKFDLKMVSSNQFDNTSPRVSSVTKLAVLAKVSIRGTSSPSQILLPIANWKPRHPAVSVDDQGPQIVHVYELLNSGPSTFSKASLEVELPYHYKNDSLLYVVSFETEGPINCTTDIELNPLNLGGIPPRETETEGRNRHQVRRREVESTRDSQNDLQTLDCNTADCLRLRCQVGRLVKGKNAIVFIYSRLTVNNFLRTENQNRSYMVQSTASFNVIEMPYKNLDSELSSNSTMVSVSVMWVAEPPQSVPGWVVALAVLAGLLLLALLIFIIGSAPPQEDCTEKEQLQPEENGNTDA
uniref:Integrin, alpha V n=1 Tax=Labrus bergylta TaxID=56723 RepID=A0A3Q3NBL0_9LABR